MSTPTTPDQTPNKNQEEIISHSSYLFEFLMKKKYSDNPEDWFYVFEMRINGESYRLEYRSYDELLRDLKKKIGILEYVNNETYQALKKEIILDLAYILYKLDNGERS